MSSYLERVLVRLLGKGLLGGGGFDLTNPFFLFSLLFCFFFLSLILLSFFRRGIPLCESRPGFLFAFFFLFISVFGLEEVLCSGPGEERQGGPGPSGSNPGGERYFNLNRPPIDLNLTPLFDENEAPLPEPGPLGEEDEKACSSIYTNLLLYSKTSLDPAKLSAKSASIWQLKKEIINEVKDLEGPVNTGILWDTYEAGNAIRHLHGRHTGREYSTYTLNKILKDLQERRAESPYLDLIKKERIRLFDLGETR